MSEVIYIFGCGCESPNYLTIHHKGHSVGKFCPNCFDHEQKYSSRHNQRCRLVRLETGCETCGAKIIKQSHQLGNMKRFYCPKCKSKREAQERMVRYNKQKLKEAAKSLNAPVFVDGKIVVTCPRCAMTRLEPALTKFGHVQPKRKYCKSCGEYASKYADGDNSIFRSDVAYVAGKAVAV